MTSCASTLGYNLNSYCTKGQFRVVSESRARSSQFDPSFREGTPTMTWFSPLRMVTRRKYCLSFLPCAVASARWALISGRDDDESALAA
jgi:hypothetical protein